MRKAKIHWIIFFKPILFLIVGTVVLSIYSEYEYRLLSYFLFVISFLFCIKRFWYIVSNSLKIDDSYITLRRGVFSTVKDRIPIEKVENFRIFKSLLGNILNYGTITYGNDSSYPGFKYIKNPENFLQTREIGKNRSK